MKPNHVYFLSLLLFVALTLAGGCSNGGEAAKHTAPSAAIPPFYVDLRNLTPAQTNLGYGPQARTFPVWHLMGPWTQEAKDQFRENSGVSLVDGHSPSNVSAVGWQLTWEDVPGEPNMQYVTVTVPLEQPGAYNVDIGAWCQRPDWLPWPTVGEIHIPANARPYQPMQNGRCTLSMAAQPCLGIGDVRVLELTGNPAHLKVEMRFTEPVPVEQRAEMSFVHETECFPDCGHPEIEPPPPAQQTIVSDVQWQSADTVVVNVAGSMATPFLQSTHQSGVMATLLVRRANGGFGLPSGLVTLPDGGKVCAMGQDATGGLVNMWTFPETGPSGSVTTSMMQTGKPPNPYFMPTEASREAGHPNPYLLPADATP